MEKFFNGGRLAELASVCSIGDDGMAIGGGGAVEVDANAAAPASGRTESGADLQQFLDVNKSGAGEEVAASGAEGDAPDEPTLFAGSNGVVEDDAPAADGQPEGEAPPADGQQAAQPPAPDAAAQAAQQAAIQQALAHPAVQAIVGPMQQQNQLLVQSMQFMQQQLAASQQEVNGFRQQIMQMAQAAQQRQVDQQRAARAPQPPPEGAGAEEVLRYEAALFKHEQAEEMASLKAKLAGVEQAALEQVQTIRAEAAKQAQAAEYARYKAQYDGQMATVKNTENYRFLFSDAAGPVDPQTGQPRNIGEHLHSTLYNSWAAAEAERAQAEGRAFVPPDPVHVANLLYLSHEAYHKAKSNPGAKQVNQTKQVQQQRDAQQKRNGQMKGVRPMPAQRSAGAAPAKNDNTIRNKWLPAIPGDRAILPS